MRRKVVFLLVLLSVAMNLAVLGIWAVRAAGSDSASVASYAGEIWCPLHRRLEVTAEQWRRIEPRIEEFRRRTEAVCADMNRLRVELIDLIAVPEPDLDAISAKQGEIGAGQARMQDLVIEHLLGEKEVLTVEQQRDMFDLIRRRSACAGPGRMWGLSGGADRSDGGALRQED